MQDIATKFTFRNWFDKIAWKLCPQHCLQLKFLYFALKLLRALLGAALQFLDLALHGSYLLLALCDFEL